MTKKKSASKKKKDAPLKIFGSLEDVLKASVQGNPKPVKTGKKKK